MFIIYSQYSSACSTVARMQSWICSESCEQEVLSTLLQYLTVGCLLPHSNQNTRTDKKSVRKSVGCCNDAKWWCRGAVQYPLFYGISCMHLPFPVSLEQAIHCSSNRPHELDGASSKCHEHSVVACTCMWLKGFCTLLERVALHLVSHSLDAPLIYVSIC